MILSILIPALPERKVKLDNLLYSIKSNIPNTHTNDVEILVDNAPRGVTVGSKRNALKDRATGDYIVYVDDDDIVPSYYTERILEAAKSNPDVITFNGYMTTNGSKKVPFVLRLGEKYEERKGVYYRFPNHIVPMRRELVKDIRFENKNYGEDYAYALEIKNKGLLKTEHYIPFDMYHYDFQTNKK